MTFDDFLSKWVCNELMSMVDKQCRVDIQGIQCVIRTLEKENPFIWAVRCPLTGWGDFSKWDWSDVDVALTKHYKLEG